LFALTGLTPSVHAATSKATATVDYGTKDLALGSQGSAVTQLQKDLAGLGFYSNSIDGSFGAKTKNAVVSFQKSQGLKTDGVVGSITKTALTEAQDLTLGSQGSAVTQLQKDLAKLGFYSNSIDGSFGAKTKNAVVSFQKSQGLKTDGVVGPITKAALNKGLTAPAKTKRTTVTIAAGTTYATPMYIIDSGVSGPVVMIVGGVHGNEPAGYTAAGKVKDWDIKKGKLIVLPQANKKAVENKTRTYNGDLNRDFPQSSKESCDNTLSKSIYAAVKSYDVDWLMDMHEGYNYTKISDSVGQSLIYYPTITTKTMASAIVSKLNSGISTSYKKFSLFRYPVEGSLARASGQYLGVHAFIFETSDNPSLSVRVNYHLKAADTLLSRLGVI
jgi:peptidoglycan hydrolase-like protein with peptidoglycan-binding domain